MLESIGANFRILKIETGQSVKEPTKVTLQVMSRQKEDAGDVIDKMYEIIEENQCEMTQAKDAPIGLRATHTLGDQSQYQV